MTSTGTVSAAADHPGDAVPGAPGTVATPAGTGAAALAAHHPDTGNPLASPEPLDREGGPSRRARATTAETRLGPSRRVPCRDGA